MAVGRAGDGTPRVEADASTSVRAVEGTQATEPASEPTPAQAPHAHDAARAARPLMFASAGMGGFALRAVLEDQVVEEAGAEAAIHGAAYRTSGEAPAAPLEPLIDEGAPSADRLAAARWYGAHPEAIGDLEAAALSAMLADPILNADAAAALAAIHPQGLSPDQRDALAGHLLGSSADPIAAVAILDAYARDPAGLTGMERTALAYATGAEDPAMRLRAFDVTHQALAALDSAIATSADPQTQTWLADSRHQLAVDAATHLRVPRGAEWDALPETQRYALLDQGTALADGVVAVLADSAQLEGEQSDHAVRALAVLVDNNFGELMGSTLPDQAALQALAMAARDKPQAVAALARLVATKPGARQALEQLISGAPELARGFAMTRWEWNEIGLALYEELQASYPGDEALAAVARKALSMGPVDMPELLQVGRLVGDRFQDLMTRALTRANDGTISAGARELAELIQLKQLLESGSHDDLKGRTDMEALDARIAGLMPQVLGPLKDAALDEVLGPERAAGVLDRAVSYATSEAFAAYLDLLPPQERGEAIQLELAKLAAIDPAGAAAAARHLAARELERASFEVLARMPGGERQAALEAAIVAWAPGIAPEDAGALAAELAAGIGELGPTATPNALASFVGRSTKATGVLKALDELSGGKGLGQVLGQLGDVAGAVGVLAEGRPQSAAQVASAASALIKAGSGLSSLLKVQGQVLPYLGPVGDAIDLFLSVDAWMADMHRGDLAGTLFKHVQVGAAATSLAFGVMALSPAAGPGAPVVIAAAALIGTAAWAADLLLGQDDAIGEIIEKKGLYK